ncbi:uncharacterized protein LOC129759018 [Uranotaenia lowii]|uniref:uncharacterized protein LOC129759018 n=1 Tax=Uranotaenia lowii TaxID=190385 RepID=UPI00247A790B|nr:uncharacterized protein LOC129759018 [Uranotaenia lowii]
MCRDKDEGILMDNREEIKRWKQHFDEQLNGALEEDQDGEGSFEFETVEENLCKDVGGQCLIQNWTSDFRWPTEFENTYDSLILSNLSVSNTSKEMFDYLTLNFKTVSIEGCHIADIYLASNFSSLTVDCSGSIRLIILNREDYLLETLVIKETTFTEKPSNLSLLSQLKDFQMHQVGELALDASELDGLKHLKYIVITDTNVTVKLSSTVFLKSLLVMELKNCSLTTLDLSLWYLPELQKINFKNNQLKELPRGLNRFKALGIADFSDCKLETVEAESFQGLAELQLLHLQNNRIVSFELPLNLTFLITINLRNNELRFVELPEDQKWQRLDLDGNPLNCSWLTAKQESLERIVPSFIVNLEDRQPGKCSTKQIANMDDNQTVNLEPRNIFNLKDLTQEIINLEDRSSGRSSTLKTAKIWKIVI